MRRGFTVLEVLVVVGIIGVLMAVMLSSTGGASDSARAAKCLANLHSLASACHTVAMTETSYPLAGSREIMGREDGASVYSEAKGWISWASMAAYKSSPKSHQSSAGWFISTYETDNDKRIYALTNGAIWQAISGNASSYVCPKHIECAKRKKVVPVWSYVMNSYFGWDTSKGGKSRAPGGSISFSGLTKGDRMLLLAELPFNLDNTTQEKACSFSTGSGTALDPTLQCGSSYNESIGFNHKDGKRWYAHVCFADGHTEKLELPKGANQSQIQELSKWLCAGADVSYNGSKYEELK